MKLLIHFGHDMKVILVKASCAMVKAMIPRDSIAAMLHDGSLPVYVLSRVSMMAHMVEELQIVGLDSVVEMEGWQEFVFSCLTNCAGVYSIALDDVAFANEDIMKTTRDLARQFMDVYPDRALGIGTVGDVYVPAAL